MISLLDVWGSMIKYFLIFLFTSISIGAQTSYSLPGQPLNIFERSFNVNSLPPGVFNPLFSWRDKNQKEKCLFYKTPIRTQLGQLIVTETKNCSLATIESKIPLAENIKSLTIDKTESGFILVVDGKKMSFDFPFSRQWTLLMGSPQERGRLQEGVYCRLYEKGCRVEKDQCSDCQIPFYTTSLNRFCANKTQRRCGRVSCGRKNEIACLRKLSLKENITCEEAKALVFCHKGRVPYCEGSGRITCK